MYVFYSFLTESHKIPLPITFPWITSEEFGELHTCKITKKLSCFTRGTAAWLINVGAAL